MYFSDTKKQYDQYIAYTYKRLDMEAVSGSGAICVDGAGKQYIDFASGIAVNALGFTNSAWTTAVKEQIDQIAHISNYFYTRHQAKLAKLLCERTGMKKVYFCNSGTEANECAIKAARKYGSDHYGPQRHEIVTLVNSFHGRTMGALAATGQDAFHKNFGPHLPGFAYAVANDGTDLAAKVNENTCAILIETIQGEGGVVPLDPAFLAQIAAICKEKDILLVIDEVQTGVARTGSFVSYSQFGLRPDIVTLAKGLGGGLPIGATLFGDKTQDTLQPGDQGSTFGGNPVVCAGGVAIVETMDGKFLDDVAEKGKYLTAKLREMEGVAGVTGAGLMLGIQLEEGLVAAEVMTECLKQGLMVLTAKDKVRLLPPLIITTAEIDKGLAIFQEVLRAQKEKQDETPA